MKRFLWLALPAGLAYLFWLWLRRHAAPASKAERQAQSNAGNSAAPLVAPFSFGLPGYSNALPGFRPQDGYKDGALSQEAGVGFNGDSGADISASVRPGQELGAGFNGGGGGSSGGAGASGVV